ncbi:MAG: hypothetical protein GY928_09155 [Colwellia sp.]|nr:hypothetical protein [Colwellia sp.]
MKISVTDGLGVSESLKIGSTEDNTNRTVHHHDSENPTDSGKIDGLIKYFAEDRILDLEKFLSVLVGKFSMRFQKLTKCFFRGFPISERDNLESNKIGPSPKPKDNRYSIEGEQCLYLIDDKRFLSKELNASSLLIQDYDKIPLCSMRIADLSPENNALDNSLALAFQRTESGRTASGYEFEKALMDKGESRYSVSQLLKMCFKKNGWDGFFIPGVHGGSGEHYHNLTIWGDNLASWPKWCHNPYYNYDLSDKNNYNPTTKSRGPKGPGR